MRKTPWKLIPAALAILALGGCAHERTLASRPSSTSPLTPRPPSDHLVIHAAGGEYVDAKVTPTAMNGPSIELARFPGGFRGRAYGHPVDVSVDETQQTAHGLYGTRPIQISVQSEADGVRTRGLIGGYISDFKANPREIKGMIGPCSYQLEWNGASYEGERACRRRAEPLELRIPSVMAGWSSVDVMSSLGLFLLARS